VNINAKDYWENRFASGDWEDKEGRLQTKNFAKNIVKLINISFDFSGKILDFGCGLGDAMPIYREHFERASLIGVDRSKTAIAKCKEKYSDIAEFIECDYIEVTKADVIISCAVFEHLSDQMEIAKHLLTKCTVLYIFVPYKETIVFGKEHVNSYDDNSFNDFEKCNSTIFISKGWSQYGLRLWLDIYLKNLLRPLLGKKIVHRKRMIMFQLKGKLQNG